MSVVDPRLLELVRGCVAQGPVVLSSGQTSDFYVDGRLVTLSPEGSALIGAAALALARELEVTALVGPTTGACPMVSAAGVLAWQQGAPLKLAYVRAQAKGHGMQKAIEGPALGPSDRVLVVDDVLTSGGSLRLAIERLREETGAGVVHALVVLARPAGGAAALVALGVSVHALLRRQDLQPEWTPGR
ncbi:MAG: orotate phosphoribosyltransferase [Planctomycetota bacterium]